MRSNALAPTHIDKKTYKNALECVENALECVGNKKISENECFCNNCSKVFKHEKIFNAT